jgi:hypothetical protein
VQLPKQTALLGLGAYDGASWIARQILD